MPISPLSNIVSLLFWSKVSKTNCHYLNNVCVLWLSYNINQGWLKINVLVLNSVKLMQYIKISAPTELEFIAQTKIIVKEKAVFKRQGWFFTWLLNSDMLHSFVSRPWPKLCRFHKSSCFHSTQSQIRKILSKV